MTVLENVEYGLRVKGVAKRERGDRAARGARDGAPTGRRRARPVQLSGGQRQRVALARAIVNRPEGAAARRAARRARPEAAPGDAGRAEAIQRELGITFVYVTHDQDEALTMSDRIAVFNDGRIEQIGTPAEVYERPANEFVAGFVGTSNVLERGGAGSRPPREDPPAGRRRADCPRASAAAGRVREVAYLGSVTRYVVETGRARRSSSLQQNLDTSAAQGLRKGARHSAARLAGGGRVFA
jgi:putative spermidine/putrescine transport system ATP-binding protein